MNKNRQNKNIVTQMGFAHIAILATLVLIVSAIAGAFVYSNQSNAKNSKTNQNPPGSKTNKMKPLSAADVAQLEATPPSRGEAPSQSATSQQTAPVPATANPSVISQAPPATPEPHNVTVTVSSDGCYATAKGLEGMIFEVGAYKSTKGGSATFTLPASGTLTKATGGYSGMIGYGKLSSSTQGAYDSKPITAASCPAP